MIEYHTRTSNHHFGGYNSRIIPPSVIKRVIVRSKESSQHYLSPIFEKTFTGLELILI